MPLFGGPRVDKPTSRSASVLLSPNAGREAGAKPGRRGEVPSGGLGAFAPGVLGGRQPCGTFRQSLREKGFMAYPAENILLLARDQPVRLNIPH